MSKISDNLWLGSLDDANNHEFIEKINPSLIISILDDGMKLTKWKDIEYYQIFVKDEEGENIGRYFERCHKLIYNIEQEGGIVFVHCGGGVSRSSTIVIAYIMRTKKIPMIQVKDFIFDCRSIISPNKSFEKQLKTYEKYCLSIKN